MKEMLEGNSGLRSEFTSVSAYYDSKTYSATFSFRPILLLVSVRYRGDSPLHAVAGEGTKDIYSIETSTPVLIMYNVSWNGTTISFRVQSNTDQTFYFWGIG
mgnify:CR=1 FL=1